MTIVWQWKSFSELSAHDLYAILKLRQDVFCIEQDCLYPDIDGEDPHYLHLLGWQTLLADESKPHLAAYLRVAPPRLKYDEASLGRVVTSPHNRGDGIGKMLMTTALNHMDTELGYPSVRISAQSYLELFYKDFGFETVSTPYLEDDIPHIEMLRRTN